MLNAVVERNHACDLFAHFPTGLASKQPSALRIHCGRQFTHNFPLRSRFTNLPGNTVPVISNEQRWDSARLGAEMRSVRGRTRFQAELALIPYAKYRNEDSHWLRQNTLGPAPNIIATGHGRGAQFEFEVRRSFPDFFDLEFGLGYRYWKMESTKGTMTFVGESFPVVDLMSERQGVMFSVTKTW